MRDKNEQISNSLLCGILLAISGGCMDAYSYIFRGNVFANAQTGNVLLFGVNLVNGSMDMALKFLWPILAFSSGIVLSDIIKQYSHKIAAVHWRRIAIVLEAVILLGVAALPQNFNFLANALISFSCGIQVESFRKLNGNSIATTMCIGNLRNATYNLDEYFHTKQKSFLKKALLYYGLIMSFMIGAITESLVIRALGQQAILISVILLIIVFVHMQFWLPAPCPKKHSLR